MNHRVREWITRLPQSLVIGWLYNASVSIELGLIQGLDGFTNHNHSHIDLSRLTALIKTFERPAVLRRLLRSLKRCYPDLHVIVVDDSKEPNPIEGVEWIQLPFDSGVSLGRSTGLRWVKTHYVLILDDDFVLTRTSGIREALREMEKYPEVDIMGGKVVDLPCFRLTDYRKSSLNPTKSEPIHPIGNLIGPYPVYDKVANFYIARIERLRLVDWIPTIKRVDHTDFFTRARGVLTTVYNQNLSCLHAKTPFDRHYLKYRRDYW